VKYQVILTARAKANINEALAWLQEKARHPLDEWLNRLLTAIQSLDHLPTRFPTLKDARKQVKLNFEVREM